MTNDKQSNESLGESLHRMMAHIRNEVMPFYTSIGPGGSVAVAGMREYLGRAERALADGDPVAMLRFYRLLEGYKI